MKNILLIVSILIIFTAGFVINAKLNENKPLISQPLSLSPTPMPTPKPRSEPLKVKVSIPYWDQERAVKSFKDNTDKVNYISLFWFFLNSDGKIRKYRDAYEDRSIIDFAHANNVKTEVVITNLPEDGDWDSERVEKVLRDDKLRSTHIEEIVAIVTRLGVDGVDIDYEQLDKDLIEDFSRFIIELGEALHDYNKYLGVALHPKSDDGIGLKNGSEAQDWRKLSEGADNLYIMAFGEHWDEGESGSIASLPWVERVVKYAESLGIDNQKFFLTIPLYGYAWEKDSDKVATGLTYSDVLRLLERYQTDVQWDDKAASPHFHYGEGSQYEVWFENAESVETKIKLADRANFRGVTFWRLGGEDPTIWNYLSPD